MVLSKLLLNPRSPQVQAELVNLYEMHRTMMSGFPDGVKTRERVLYRLEARQQPPYLTVLVQSESMPDWQRLLQKGYLLAPSEAKSFQMVFIAGQNFAFRLVANPTRKIKDDRNPNGKRVGLYKPEEHQEWLTRKAQQHGFRLQALTSKPPEMFRGNLFRESHKHTLKLLLVQFDGLLEVTDPQKMEAAIAEGIGSAKGFGCGLLSLVRAD